MTALLALFAFALVGDVVLVLAAWRSRPGPSAPSRLDRLDGVGGPR